MEMIYRVKKPETIQRFMKENNIPSKIMELENNRPKIEVNKKSKSRLDTVKKNEKIHFFVKDEPLDKTIKPQDLQLKIVYEDPYMLIVDKPSDMQMMVSKAHKTDTLANGLNYYYFKHKISAKIHYVTKLDREASGLILVAKHRFIKYLLTQHKEEAITYYLKAIVEGKLELQESCIPLPVARMEGSIKREISEKGKECSTNYKVIKELKDYSLVDIWIQNKLAHQIRVHFAYFFAPIVGDLLYGKGKGEKLMLHCYKMDFIHPITEERIQFEVEEPDYFTSFLKGK